MTGPRTVLIHNILPPYRVDLFNEISEQLEEFTVLFARRDHPKRRDWAWTFGSLRVNHQVLRGLHTEIGITSIGVSFGTKRVLDRIQPDVVVVAGWDLHASWAARRWAVSNSRPLLIWTEASSLSGRTRSKRSNWVRQRFLEAFDAALVPGTKAEDYVLQLAPSIRTYRLPNSVSSQDLQPMADVNGPDRSGSIFIGELSERKGFDRLIAAYRAEPESIGRLSIAGSGELETEARLLSSDFPEHVQYLGHLGSPERVRLMQTAEVLILPSRRDPWPLVAVEALCHGSTPVLTPEVGSGPELAPYGAVIASSALSPDICNAVMLARRSHVDVGASRRDFSPNGVAQQFVASVRAECR